MRFNFTHSKAVDSSALRSVYYNENRRTMAVVTHDEHVYVYDQIPLTVFHTFINAGSVGNYFATVVKRLYGPSINDAPLNNTFLWSESDVAADMSTTSVGSSTGPHVHHEATVGTPKGLSYAGGAVITQREDEFIPLTTPDSEFPAAVQFEFHVFFTLNGSEKVFGTSAGSVNEALENYKAATSWLDLETKVVRVVQYFE